LEELSSSPTLEQAGLMSCQPRPRPREKLGNDCCGRSRFLEGAAAADQNVGAAKDLGQPSTLRWGNRKGHQSSPQSGGKRIRGDQGSRDLTYTLLTEKVDHEAAVKYVNRLVGRSKDQERFVSLPPYTRSGNDGGRACRTGGDHPERPQAPGGALPKGRGCSRALPDMPRPMVVFGLCLRALRHAGSLQGGDR